MQGPNVKKLIAHKWSLILVPVGGSAASAVQSLVTPGKIGAAYKEATAWVAQVLALIRTAPDNPYKDDEQIAEVVLKAIEERKKAAQTCKTMLEQHAFHVKSTARTLLTQLCESAAEQMKDNG